MIGFTREPLQSCVTQDMMELDLLPVLVLELGRTFLHVHQRVCIRLALVSSDKIVFSYNLFNNPLK